MIPVVMDPNIPPQKNTMFICFIGWNIATKQTNTVDILLLQAAPCFNASWRMHPVGTHKQIRTSIEQHRKI